MAIVDIGSPRRRGKRASNLGWAITPDDESHDDLIRFGDAIVRRIKDHSIFLGVEAPLWFPLRQDPETMTCARINEKYSWCGPAGAITAAITVPILTYLFRRCDETINKFEVTVDPERACPGRMVIFEVYGQQKGNHIEIAQRAACGFLAALPTPQWSIVPDDGGCVFSLVEAVARQARVKLADNEVGLAARVWTLPPAAN